MDEVAHVAHYLNYSFLFFLINSLFDINVCYYAMVFMLCLDGRINHMLLLLLNFFYACNSIIWYLYNVMVVICWDVDDDCMLSCLYTYVFLIIFMLLWFMQNQCKWWHEGHGHEEGTNMMVPNRWWRARVYLRQMQSFLYFLYIFLLLFLYFYLNM